MSTSSDASLGALRIQAQQRSDMENNGAISDPEWNQYITQSAKELRDLLIGAYGNGYHANNIYQFNLTNSQLYPLPDGSSDFIGTTGSTAAKFYKLTGVDLQYSASPSGWVTLRRFEFIERNKYAYPNSAINTNGYTNLRYTIMGNQLMFMPTPMASQAARIFYVSAMTSLQFFLPCQFTSASPAVTVLDTTGLSPGMNAYGDIVAANTTILAVTGTTTITLSNNALSTKVNGMTYFWSDASSFDGIDGWEEYVIIDAAIKAQIKQEGDYAGLAGQKADMKMRIEAMAEGRDIGEASHTSDVLGANSYGYDSGAGWGSGGY